MGADRSYGVRKIAGQAEKASSTDSETLEEQSEGLARPMLAQQSGTDPAVLPGARKAPLPARIEPQLATLVRTAPPGDEWLHEIKLDGYRIMCRLEKGKVTLFTRRGADWSDHFPSLRASIERLPVAEALLDGEMVYMKDDGHTSFLRLASALQGGRDPEGRVVYYVFDLLYLDGYDLMRAPLEARKEVLRALSARFPADSRVRYLDHLVGQGPEFFREACELSLEGSIAKRRTAPYRPGRGRDWLKVKCLHRQEFVIAGFTERVGDAAGIGALLLAFHERPRGSLRYAGRVGTGWDEATMRALRRRLEKLEQSESALVDGPQGRAAAGVHWVQPALVVEVEYLSWNGAGMLRHPSFEGLRADKPASEVVAERI